MRTSVLCTVLGVALVGFACKGPDDPNPDTLHYSGLARGANVVPGATLAPSDTLAQGTVGITIDTTGGTIIWGAAIQNAPTGTLDTIALYQVAAGANLPAAPSALLCAGAACTTLSGTLTLASPAAAKTIWTSARGYGTQVVFFTTTARTAGAMRGTLYATPQ